MYEMYGPSPRARYDVVLTGAGISMDPPSRIPSGNTLMQNTWHRLLKNGFTPAQLTVLEGLTMRIDAKDVPIWLEPLVEILDSHIQDRDIIFSTYVDVSAQTPNAHHLLLAKLDAEQITLNMDTLIEAAGGEAWHLHGRWDDPSSIVTTVRQYADGLPVSDQQRLEKALNGKNVLVIGYSGRDTDVMPVLMRSSPARVHWMQYGGTPVEATVDRLKEVLGNRMSIFNGGPKDVLPLLPQSRLVTPKKPHDPGITPQDLYKEISFPRRVLAASAVAYDLSQHDVVTKLLSPLRFTGIEEMKRRKLIARTHVRTGKAKAALKILFTVPRDRSTLLAWPHTANEISATLPHAGYPALGQLADTITSLHPRSRDAAMVRRALALQTKGHLTKSARLLKSQCDDPHLYQRIGVTGVVDALSAYADTLKILGKYHEAHNAAFHASTQGEYANLSQRGFAFRRLADIAHVSGIPKIRVSENKAPQTPEELLEEIYSEADAYNERNLAFWTAVCLADISVSQSDEQCSYWLTEARNRVTDRSKVSETFLLLTDTKRELIWGDPANALRIANHAESETHGLTIALLAAKLTRAQCLACLDQQDFAAMILLDAFKELERISAASLAARARLLHSAIMNLDTSSHASAYLKSGWNHEATAAELPPERILRYPWPVVL